jgi:hypothetical protein
MNFLVQWAIKTVLAWAYSLTSEDFAAAFAYVKQAQEKLSSASSAEKRTWVQGQLAGFLGGRGTGKAINFLIELAVAKLTAGKK